MPDLTYTLNVDTTRMATAMSEVRSQMNMAMAGPGGLSMAGSGGGLGSLFDTTGAAMGGLASFGGAASAGMGMMMQGMSQMPGMNVGTHTGMEMAGIPHYGVVNANVSLASEWMNAFYGPQAALPFAPPGVAPLQWGSYLNKEHSRRISEAVGSGAMAAASVGAGLAGGMAIGAIGTKIGSAFGPIGALVGGLAGFTAGEELTGVATREVRKGHDIVKELGDIIDAGRGLSDPARVAFGSAAKEVARELGRPEAEVADFLAAAPAFGMLPPQRDAGQKEEFKRVLKSMFEDVQDIAGLLHQSMGQALSTMKSMERIGFRGAGGAMALVGWAGAIGAGTTPTEVFNIGMGGAALGTQAQIGGRFGFDLSMREAFQASHAGLSREELHMAGGVRGMTQAFMMSDVQAGFSPLGMMQIAAAPNRGTPLPGNLADTLAMGMSNIMDDPINNILGLQARRGTLLRRLGPQRMMEMEREQMLGVTDLISEADPTINKELFLTRMYEGQGLNETQAMAKARLDLGLVGGGNADIKVRTAMSAAAAEVSQNRQFRAASVEFQESGVLGVPSRLKHFLQEVGSDIAGVEASFSSQRERAFYRDKGLPDPNVRAETIGEVASGRVDLKRIKVDLPTEGALGKGINSLIAMVGGDTKDVKGLLEGARRFEEAVGKMDLDPGAHASETTRKAISAIGKRMERDDSGERARLIRLKDAIASGDKEETERLGKEFFKGTGVSDKTPLEEKLSIMGISMRRAGIKEEDLPFGAGLISKGLTQFVASRVEETAAEKAMKAGLSEVDPFTRIQMLAKMSPKDRKKAEAAMADESSETTGKGDLTSQIQSLTLKTLKSLNIAASRIEKRTERLN